jgi:putative transposase
MAYNHTIALHKRYYKLTGKSLNKYVIMKHYTKLKKVAKYAWIREIPSQALQDIVERIDRGYCLFFSNIKKNIKSAPPSFRKIKKFKSFTLKQQNGWRFMSECKIKIGKYAYRLVNDRLPIGDIKTVTIKRDSLNDLYVCFSVELEMPEVEAKSGKIAGFDFGLKTFLTVSDGQIVYEIESPLFFKESLKKIKKLSKSLSSKKKGSNNRKRAKYLLAREHKRIADKRRDWFFKLSHELTILYDVLCFETLNLKGMVKMWGKKITDLAFAEFISILKYVASLKGKQVVFIDRWFASSKTCHTCGHVYKELSLSERYWRCQKCHKVNDRDGNAAMNIRTQGIESSGLADVSLSAMKAICA